MILFQLGLAGKINCPPSNTLIITDNLFSGPFVISEIMQSSNSSFYSILTIDNAIPGASPGSKLVHAEFKYWALNELFMEGVVKKNGVIEGVEIVAVTYGRHYSLVLKDGKIYNKILKI